MPEDGILAFVTNRSFIESRTFDGFRKMVAQDYNEIWVVDLGGDVRANPKLSGTKHNVFGIQTGVAIAFMVRRKGVEGCTIRYVRRPEDDTAEDKLSWLGGSDLAVLETTLAKPNARSDWLNTETAGGWDEMLSIGDPATKSATSTVKDRSIFKLFAIGVSTNRDEWVFDRDSKLVAKKGEALRLGFLASVKSGKVDDSIKWSRNLKGWIPKAKFGQQVKSGVARPALYRPFSKRSMYDSNVFVDERGALDRYLPVGSNERIIALSGAPAGKPFHAIATLLVPSLDLIEKTKIFPRYRHSKSGERLDNITDWALNKFVAHYGKGGVTKDSIFYYVYAVLHDPIYRETYALNLKREFPRIPFLF